MAVIHVNFLSGEEKRREINSVFKEKKRRKERRIWNEFRVREETIQKNGDVEKQTEIKAVMSGEMGKTNKRRAREEKRKQVLRK